MAQQNVCIEVLDDHALGGIEAVFASLLHLGLTKDSLALYESSLKSGKCLVLAHGSPEQVVRAKAILETAGARDIALHAD